MANNTAATTPKRAHRATYARDKRNGGYLIRIQGPYPEMFAGREVPVTMKSGEEHNETLKSLVWTGIDTGTPDRPGTGERVALYQFVAKPREQAEELDF